MIRLVLLSLLLVASSGAQTESTIEIYKVSEISDIAVLDKELEQMVAKVRQCAAAGMASASDCYCEYPGKLAAIRKAYYRLVEKYPSWTEGSIRWWDKGSGFSSNLYLRGIRQQLEQPCS